MHGNYVKTVVAYEFIRLGKLNKTTKTQTWELWAWIRTRYITNAKQWCQHCMTLTGALRLYLHTFGAACSHCGLREYRLQIGLQAVSEFITPYRLWRSSASVRRLKTCLCRVVSVCNCQLEIWASIKVLPHVRFPCNDTPCILSTFQRIVVLSCTGSNRPRRV
jgi:hypothetical protein